MTKFIKYIWLIMAVGSFVAICCGKEHQVLSLAIATLMYVVCRDAAKKEERDV